MRIIAVDTNKYSLQELVNCLKGVYPEDEIIPFTDPMGAVKFGFNNRIDMVFTEIPMRGVDGFQLARLLHSHNEDMKICFVTETIDFLNETLQIQTDGYLLKPITEKKLKERMKSQPG